MTGRTLFILRDTLAFAEREYALAEFIDETARQQEQRAYWSGEIERLRTEIAALTPHDYHPSTVYMGDCTVCGLRENEPIHSRPRAPR